MKYREALESRAGSFKRYDRRHICTGSVEQEDDSPEDVTVSRPFILVKISIPQVSRMTLFSRLINTNVIFEF